ncbi:recombinase RecT [Clostridium novyi]|uniref:recombinase RecT n=1 Tax=Clostridium novyi TaxID=1542 RepID=UPI0023B78176|nr:recombinase RecT [Clostridium novyi]
MNYSTDLKNSTYWTKDQIIKHKNKFSKSDFGWNKDFDAMAKKTVLRNMLSKWGILSIEMQNAYTADSNIIKDAIVEDSDVQSNIEYINTDFEVKDENQENNLADN